jgi:hypothetical protein
MLSPHEFTTLMLVAAAPEQIDLDRDELDTLLERQLVALEPLASGAQRPRLTPRRRFNTSRRCPKTLIRYLVANHRSCACHV